MIPQVVAATDLLSFWSPGSPRDGEDHIRWIPVPSQDPSTKRYGSTSGSPSACVTSRTCWRNAEWRCPTRSSALDESLRTDDRGRPTKAWPEAAYDLAPRWGLSDNRWSYGLSLAGRRRRRRSPRRAGPIQANKQAALKLMRKLLRKFAFGPRAIGRRRFAIIQRCRPCSWIEHCHERGRWKNNRAENSHQPARRRECKMQRFKSLGSARNSCQRMPPSTTSSTSNVISPQPKRTARFALWRWTCGGPRCSSLKNTELPALRARPMAV